MRAPCPGQRSGGGRARAVCGMGRALRGEPRPLPAVPTGHASAHPAEGPLAPPWGNAAGPGPPGGGSWSRRLARRGCGESPRLNSRVGPPAACIPLPAGHGAASPARPPLRRPARPGPALPCPPRLCWALPSRRAPSASRRAFCTRRPSGSRAISTSPTTR